MAIPQDGSTSGPLIKGRIQALDVLRGVAVFGILVVNVQQIFLPVVLASAPVAVIPGATGSKLAWFVTDAFFESKFITVFSLLFGAGFRLQWMRYKELGKPFVRLYLRWVAMLACFGLIHATFFYYADVLVLYALTALVLLLFRNRGPRSMFRTRLILLFVMTAWHVLLSGPDPDASATRHQVVQNLKSIREGGDVTLAGERVALPVRAARIAEHLHGDIHGADEATAQALAQGEGPFWLGIRARLVLFASFIAFFTPLFLMWRTLGLFLIAAALVESGFLAAASRAVWRRTAIIGLLVGLPMTPVASWMRMEIQDAPRSTVYVAATLHDLSALALAAAIVALVLLACVGRDLTPVPRAFARVGRHALTHYIGQSLILSLIASSAGMGAFGRLSRLELLLLCLPIFAFQLAFSSLWMRRFSMGPLERVWRRFTYGR